MAVHGRGLRGQRRLRAQRRLFQPAGEQRDISENYYLEDRPGLRERLSDCVDTVGRTTRDHNDREPQAEKGLHTRTISGYIIDQTGIWAASKTAGCGSVQQWVKSLIDSEDNGAGKSKHLRPRRSCGSRPTNSPSLCSKQGSAAASTRSA